MSKPRYVERGGEQTYAAPFLQTQTRLRAWPLAADPVALQRVVDRYLNAPAGGALSFRPMLSTVLLAHAPIGATRSLTEPDAGYGWTSETDLAFWMLVGRGREADGRWTLEQLAWFLPYVWVNVPQTMATGREVYGYPKQFAAMETAESTGDPSLVVRASTTVLPTHGPDTELTQRPVLQIRATGASAPARAAVAFEDVAQALAHLGATAIAHPGLDVDIGAALLRDLLRREVPMVFLKQFRDVVDPTAACYQAVLESPARVESVQKAWPLLDPVEVTVWEHASHPIATELGLGTPVDGKLGLRAPVGLEVHFNFEVCLAKELWRAP